MSPHDENSAREYDLRLSLFEAMTRYLYDDDRISFGTGTDVPQETEPLPPLWRGEPLYDATKAWIKHVWGEDNRMPPEGLRLWNHLLRASRRGESNKTEWLHQWAAWLISAPATAFVAAIAPTAPEGRSGDQQLPANEARLKLADVPAEFRELGRRDGSVLTSTYLAETGGWDFSSVELTNAYQAKELTYRLKVGRTYAYLYTEMYGLREKRAARKLTS